MAVAASFVDARWSQLQSDLDRLYVHLGSMENKQHLVAAWLDQASKVVGQVLHDQRVMAKRSEVMGRTVAGFELSQMSLEMDGLKEKSLLLGSRSSEKVMCGGVLPLPPAMRSAHELFDRMPLEENPADYFDLALTKASVLSEGHSQNVLGGMYIGDDAKLVAGDMFDEMPQRDVNWDEEFQNSSDLHIGLLQQLAMGGEYLFDKDTEPSTNLNANGKLPDVCGVQLLHMDAVYDACEEMPSADAIWDKDMSRDCDLCHGLLEQLAQGEEHVLDEERMLITTPDFSEEVTHQEPSNLNTRDNLLQQLAMVTKLNDEKTEASLHIHVDEVLTYVDDLPLFLELYMGVTDRQCDEILGDVENTESKSKEGVDFDTVMLLCGAVLIQKLEFSLSYEHLERQQCVAGYQIPDTSQQVCKAHILNKVPSWMSGSFSPWMEVILQVPKEMAAWKNFAKEKVILYKTCDTHKFRLCDASGDCLDEEVATGWYLGFLRKPLWLFLVLVEFMGDQGHERQGLNHSESVVVMLVPQQAKRLIFKSMFVPQATIVELKQPDIYEFALRDANVLWRLSSFIQVSLVSDLNTHNGLLLQLTLGAECIEEEKAVLQTKLNIDDVITLVHSSSLCLEHDGNGKIQLVERTSEHGRAGANQILTSEHGRAGANQILTSDYRKITEDELLGVVLHFPTTQVYEAKCAQCYNSAMTICLLPIVSVSPWIKMKQLALHESPELCLGIFGARESEQKLEMPRMTRWQWDPGIQEMIAVTA